MINIFNSLKNPKTRSIVLLCIYFLFFVFVFIVISVSNNNYSNYNYQDEINKNDEIKVSYDYIVTVNDNDNIYMISDSQYSYDNINRLLNISEYIEKTIYRDNSEKIIYNIKLDKYFEFFNIDDMCNEYDCTNIDLIITVYKYDYINKVNIDLSNYYEYNYNINIEYSKSMD